jgi:hypothetical protein
MTIYYFGIEVHQTGWIRIEASDNQTVMDDIHENGFDASDIIESNVRTQVVSIEGGEEGD